MLFLLMPIVALFLTYPAVNLWINLGLKIKASWLKGLKYVPQLNYPINNWRRIF